MRSISFIVSILFLTNFAEAHFVFVVPATNGTSANVIISEALVPDESIPVETITGTKLFAGATAAAKPLTLAKTEHSFTAEIPTGTNVLRGVTDLGVMARGEAKPGILVYYPKAILGDPFDAKTQIGDQAAMELIPTGAVSSFKLHFVVDGKPVTDAEVDVILPDGKDQIVKTDKEGNTPAFTAPGRYGAWARHVEATAGELNGKHYDEVRKYATLVFDIPKTSLSGAYAPLPQAASSFGAVATDGWLYVYGGHTSDTHSYSTQSVSGKFHRLQLSGHHAWEELAGGPPLQGMNLATWHGKIYRIGGMQPHNKEGEPADVRSVADCAVFDPATKAWTELPPLPEPRSSHDVAVIGDKLYVVGGWNLTGDADGAKWPESGLVLDLNAKDAKWQSIPQSFHRRALIAAAYKDKLYVLGGFESEQEPSKSVDIFDPATGTWSKGPEIPGDDMNGFGPAACTSNGSLFLSVGDGNLFRLNAKADGWEKIAQTTPRIVHRMVANESDLLILGGAAQQKQLNLIEVVSGPLGSN